MADNKPITIEDLKSKDRLRERFPRKVLVLSGRNSSRSLTAAVREASIYSNPSGEAEVEYSYGQDEGWRWEKQFQEAKSRPNTFIALEDGSVLQKGIVDIQSEIEMISSMGGGLSFGHQSGALFRYLGADGFCVLADQPLEKLLELISVNKYLDEMNLLTPVYRGDQYDSAQRSARDFLAQGLSVMEVSRRVGVNRSTIHRWAKAWKANSGA